MSEKGRIRISTSDQWIWILEAQKHMIPQGPNTANTTLSCVPLPDYYSTLALWSDSGAVDRKLLLKSKISLS
jgi:hypothetical protein